MVESTESESKVKFDRLIESVMFRKEIGLLTAKRIKSLHIIKNVKNSAAFLLNY